MAVSAQHKQYVEKRHEEWMEAVGRLNGRRGEGIAWFCDKQFRVAFCFSGILALYDHRETPPKRIPLREYRSFEHTQAVHNCVVNMEYLADGRLL